eukprot:2333325-Prymnesium_polylepis.1
MAYLSAAIGSMGSLQRLGLSSNKIGDTGMTAFADAIKPTAENPSGALANLKELWLGSNQIGDAGMIEFSRQIA